MKDKLLIICGPTATGKTELAIQLAKEFDGELISADSRQVYRGMDIGTGKNINKQINKFQISNKFQIANLKFPACSCLRQQPMAGRQIGYYLVDGVKIWLYDIVEPDYQFNVADYKECADLVIADILKRGKLPILVGGTGLYIKAVVDKIESLGVPPDWELRKKLANLPAGRQVIELQIILKKLDPERLVGMNNSDSNNPRRLIRAIEIAQSHLSLHNPASLPADATHQALQAGHFSRPASVLFIGLTTDYKNLYQRIDQRVEQRIKNGVENEVKNLVKAGYSFDNSVLGTTIGYKEWSGLETREKIIQQWKFNEHAYARRQMTWFRKDKRINWFDISEKGWENKVIQKTQDF